MDENSKIFRETKLGYRTRRNRRWGSRARRAEICERFLQRGQQASSPPGIVGLAGFGQSPADKWLSYILSPHHHHHQWWRSETVGLRTRPIWDQKNRSWSWSCRFCAVWWNTISSRSSS